jgi:hypothetical protein
VGSSKKAANPGEFIDPVRPPFYVRSWSRRFLPLLDKAPWPSLDYAFPNQARMLTSKFPVVNHKLVVSGKTIFTETEVDLWLSLQLKSGAE